MKIVFISNFFNHHQKYISDYWYKATDKQYWFISTADMPAEQKKLGYKEYTEDYIIKLNTYNYNEVKKIINEVDVVIIGSGDESLIDERIHRKKLVFRYSERLFRNRISFLRFLRRMLVYRKRNPRNSEMYLLCASAYTAQDYLRCGLFKGRSFKWGYFPEAKSYKDISELIRKKNKKQILWCGRLIDLKHPDDVLILAKKLKENSYDFKVKIIGNGQLYEKMQMQIEEWSLQDVVEMPGPLPSDLVRLEMEKAGIYLFTSDFEEGWGAVLNESMNSGCAVVASHAIGSVPFLLKHNKNGFIYKNGDIDSLYANVTALLGNPQLQSALGMESYKTISEQWSPEIAAKRFMELARCILNNREPAFNDDGPCSRAAAIPNDWFV